MVRNEGRRKRKRSFREWALNTVVVAAAAISTRFFRSNITNITDLDAVECGKLDLITGSLGKMACVIASGRRTGFPWPLVIT